MTIDISLITPMYNEEDCIEKNITNIIEALNKTNLVWEYILVDDGSKDKSYEIAKKILNNHDNCHIIHYDLNMGRGYAMKQGFEFAKGNYIITTESDLSWGADIIIKLYNELLVTGNDAVIASTYISEEGYKNVPFYRKILSLLGNWIIRVCIGGNITMFSGMTRGYKKSIIKSLYLEENDKIIHVEIISKLKLLGYKIAEIPAKIKWDANRQNKTLKSHLGIFKHVMPHLLFVISDGAFKIIVLICFLTIIGGSALIIFGIVNKIFLITETPKPNLVIYGAISITLAIISILISIISLQMISIKKHIIHLQALIKKSKDL